jgi:hypothetical protein
VVISSASSVTEFPGKFIPRLEHGGQMHPAYQTRCIENRRSVTISPVVVQIENPSFNPRKAKMSFQTKTAQSTNMGRVAGNDSYSIGGKERNMAKAELKSFGKADEVRQFPKGRLELVQVGGATIGRAVFEPGWRWASSVQPLVKTASCEAPHFQYHVSGLLRIRMDDGTEFECKPGDVSLLPSGHDAWVVGNEPAVVVDFQGMLDYARGYGRDGTK